MTRAHAGVRELNNREEQDALQLYLRVCGQGQGAEGSRNIDGFNIHCKSPRQQVVQEVLNHQVNVQGSPNQQQDIVFVQPPAVNYQHNLQLNGSPGQGGQTKIYVLPQQANHQLATNFNLGQITRSKPEVHFLNRNGQNNNIVSNNLNVNNNNLNVGRNTLNSLNPLSTSASSQVLSNTGNILNNIQGTQAPFLGPQSTTVNQFVQHNQRNPLSTTGSLQQNSILQRNPNNFPVSQQQNSLLQRNPNNFPVSQQQNSGGFINNNLNNPAPLPIPVRAQDGAFITNQNQLPIRINDVVGPHSLPGPIPVRLQDGTAPILHNPQHHFHEAQHIVRKDHLQEVPLLKRQGEALVAHGPPLIQKQQVHVQEIPAQFIQKQQQPLQVLHKQQQHVQLQELPVQVIHKEQHLQPAPVQFLQKQQHQGIHVEQIPVQLIQNHPQPHIGFQEHFGGEHQFLKQHPQLPHEQYGVNPFDQFAHPHHQGFHFADGPSVFGAGPPPGYAKA
jgi:hypothetical protein